uniref:Dynein regulatory complex protein 10 n=1 Tax=Anas platyrhynchos TaxID=8839 RepID=A0A8B9ZEP7_ANAPL
MFLYYESVVSLLDLATLKPQPPIMGIATAKKAVTALDATKMLDPRWLKPDSIETEWVISVLDETIAKLEMSCLVPPILASLDRFSALLGPEITKNLTEHQKLASKMEHLLASPEEEDAVRAEERRVSLCLLEQQLKSSVRNILRLLLANPSICKALKCEAGTREPPAEAFIKAFREFRNFMLERLLTNPTKEEEMVRFMEDVSLRIKKNTETVTASRAELLAAICTRDEEVQYMQDLAENCKTDILQVKWEGEKQQKEELQASRAKCASLQQDIQQLRAQLKKLVLQHRASELALRKVNGRTAEYEEVHAAYTKEKAELSVLMEKHALLLQEYSQIEEERRIRQEKKKKALEELATMTLAATRIQAFWRGYLIRSTFKSKKKKKGKGKGKGKDTKAKK